MFVHGGGVGHALLIRVWGGGGWCAGLVQLVIAGQVRAQQHNGRFGFGGYTHLRPHPRLPPNVVNPPYAYRKIFWEGWCCATLRWRSWRTLKERDLLCLRCLLKFSSHKNRDQERNRPRSGGPTGASFTKAKNGRLRQLIGVVTAQLSEQISRGQMPGNVQRITLPPDSRLSSLGCPPEIFWDKVLSPLEWCL